MTLTAPTGRLQTLAAAIAVVGMAATVGAALGFEHIGGYIPCALCLEQRTPYYLGVPLMLVALVSAVLKGPAVLTRGLLLAGGGLMLWGAGLGIHHAGVEWGWWMGPDDCAAVAFAGEGSLLDQLNTVVPPACDQAAGRFLGLSFAGWNVVAAGILAGVTLHGALTRKA